MMNLIYQHSIEKFENKQCYHDFNRNSKENILANMGLKK